MSMFDLIKKKYKKGDELTIQTDYGALIGQIESFEESCIVLKTDSGEEIISNSSIKGFSIKKTTLDTEGKNLGEFIEKRDNAIQENDIANNNIKKFEDPEKLTESSAAEDKKENSNTPKKQPKTLKTTKPEIFSSFKEMYEDKQALRIEAENQKIVPANGTIVRFFVEKEFGFILSKSKEEIWFHKSEIIDGSLLESLNRTFLNGSIPVLYGLGGSFKGFKAVCVQKPKTVNEILILGESFLEKKNPEKARDLMDQVLNAYPTNYSACELRKNAISKLPAWSGSYGRTTKRGHTTSKPTKSGGGINSFYQNAKRAHNIEKNYEKALELYLKALENNEKKESVIKDVAMLYITIEQHDEAKKFMEEHVSLLSKDLTTYNYLENFYYAVKQFDESIKYLNKLLENSKSKGFSDKNKESMLLAKKGFALIQLDKVEDAKKSLNKALLLNPQYSYASRLLDALKNDQDIDKDEVNTVINEAEFDSFGGGLSVFIRNTLEEYTAYSGLPAKAIDSWEFSKHNIEQIQEHIKKAGVGKPKERALYLLTEAKLIKELQPENEGYLRLVLARHCYAMALNHIYERSHIDIVRNYYLEAFRLDENFQRSKRRILLYILTYKNSYESLVKFSSQEEIGENLINSTFNELFDNDDVSIAMWEGLLALFLSNVSIAAYLTKKLFALNNLKEKSLSFLEKMFDGFKPKNIEEYANLWNQAREKRQRDHDKWMISIKSLHKNNNNIESLASQLQDVLNEAKKEWLSQLDRNRLNKIQKDIFDSINRYIKQSGYRDKERYCEFAKAQTDQLIEEIKEKPTKFSYEGFIPLLEKTLDLLTKSFKDVEAASEPVVKTYLLGEALVVCNDNDVLLKLTVENSRESSPIRNILIQILEDENVVCSDKKEFFDSIDGGESQEFHLKVKLSKKAIKDKATPVKVKIEYKKRNSEEAICLENDHSLRLYSSEEFKEIPNPYEVLANGGPVTDSKMFYGRNEFIERITDAIIKANSKHVVIYGQKRSGKSSVLYHLKKALENTGNTFCVSFSIGEIFDNLSASTLFHKILSSMEESLEDMHFNNIVTPEFKAPLFEEFNSSPNTADVFRKYLKSFKRLCLNTNGWENKKLVVLIDEFTYLYTAIRNGNVSETIMKQWKAINQNEESAFSAVLVGQDVFPMFKQSFPNEFGVTQDERLTYLSKPYAEKLVIEPMGKTKSGNSRFIGNAVDTIIDYTSCNPYYIQIFCARLVAEMNRKRYIEVTNTDVKEVAESFIHGGQALTSDKFDNLLNPGEEKDVSRFPQEDTRKTLDIIAKNAENIGFCLREYITLFENKDYENEILKDLVNREVLEQIEGKYKIQVRLFQEWLNKQ